MVFEVVLNPFDKVSGDGLVVYAFKNGKNWVGSSNFTRLDGLFEGMLSKALKQEQYKAETGDIFTYHTSKKILASHIYVLGLGEKAKLSSYEIRKSFALLSKHLATKARDLVVTMIDEASLGHEQQGYLLSEGLLLGSYSFNKYKSQNNKNILETVIYAQNQKDDLSKIKQGIKKAQLYAKAVSLARDLVNEPSALVTPTFLANLAKDFAKNNPQVKVSVYDQKQCEEMGMGALVGVARASRTPLKFILLEYKPYGNPKTNSKLAIVGKGITFDTGGVNIKTGEHMNFMKMDMAGAAAVLAVFSVIDEIKPQIPVLGIIAATPNLISSEALLPGDIVKAYNGKTIEILNTDAEGRVTMADSLSYAVKKGATEIIDLATLTGACMIALGTEIAALCTNNQSLKEKVIKASNEAGEKLWELPLEEDYRKLNKSEVADIANIPLTRYGGTITAALFLEEFVDKKPWVHLDIAGPAFAEKAHDYGPKGGTGYGVRTLLAFLEKEK